MRVGAVLRNEQSGEGSCSKLSLRSQLIFSIWGKIVGHWVSEDNAGQTFISPPDSCRKYGSDTTCTHLGWTVMVFAQRSYLAGRWSRLLARCHVHHMAPLAIKVSLLVVHYFLSAVTCDSGGRVEAEQRRRIDKSATCC